MKDNDFSKKEDSNLSLQQKLIKLNTKFISARHELFITTRRYYNQSIASKVVTEKKLHDLIIRCEEIKKEYFKIQKELLDNKPNTKPWSFGYDFVFNKDF